MKKSPARQEMYLLCKYPTQSGLIICRLLRISETLWEQLSFKTPGVYFFLLETYWGEEKFP